MKRIYLLSIFTVIWCFCAVITSFATSMKAYTTDICIYGATSAGITAACTAVDEGKSVFLVEPSSRIGGLTAGGLGRTDIGNVGIIKGKSINFYRRVGKMYGENRPMFTFEPKVGLAVYKQMLREANVKPIMNYRVIKVCKRGSRIGNIVLENSLKAEKQTRIKISAKEFIDCSYEGDLMARAGVSYTVGREANSMYGETYNGVQMLNEHQFPDGIDPYRIKGNPKSGLLYGISKLKVGRRGEADKHVQAYNFRITLTNDPANRIDITRPENYDSSRYELLIRLKETLPWKDGFNDVFMWDLMPNNKTDINNRGGFSTDMIGANWDYPEASYKKRHKIWKSHLDYTKGLLYFIGHDGRIPKDVRDKFNAWGYPKDEYEDNGHFTPQLYVREARRMVSSYVMTQQNCDGKKIAEDCIGWAAYNMDSHNSGRFVVNGMVKNEGDVQVAPHGIYPISYRSITPREREADNLLVPVCLSASHIAYGSIRMEPVFMVLGQTSALAACEAIDKHNGIVQKVSAKQIMGKVKE